MQSPRTIRVNGINLNVYVEGEGPPVLLLHGFPDSAHLWRKVVPHLVQAGYRVIAHDQRGFGESEAPKDVDAYRLENIVADAFELLSALGVKEKVRLVGHDWGSLIGWQMSLQFPERFERYVTVTVGHPLAFRHAGLNQRLRSWYVIAFQVPRFGEWMFSAGNFHVLRQTTRGKPYLDEDVIRWTSDLSRPGRLTAGINWYRANFTHFMSARFKRGQVPSLGVHSGRDPALTLEQMTDSSKYMDGPWQCIVMADCGHWIPLEKPEELSRHIVEWFK